MFFSSIEEPPQNAEAKGTNTECEAGVDKQLSISQSPICPPAHAKSKSRKQKRHKIGKHLLRNDAGSKTRKGGSRLVLNQSAMKTFLSTRSRTQCEDLLIWQCHHRWVHQYHMQIMPCRLMGGRGTVPHSTRTKMQTCYSNQAPQS